MTSHCCWLLLVGGVVLCVDAGTARSAEESARGERGATQLGESDTIETESAQPQPPEPPDRTITRRRPGSKPESEPGPLPPPLPALPAEFIPVPDRWRITKSLGLVNKSWFDPYNQNTLKGDRPVFGQGWFLNLSAISDSVVEPRSLPTPVGIAATKRSGSLDTFGKTGQLVMVENLITSISLINGNTVFRPPDYEFRFTSVFNWNYANVEELGLLYADPTRGTTRIDWHIGIQELFIDKHIANLTERYDFFSVRAGIQGFSTDFRGFLFQDNQPGVRIFGNYANNRLQYNLAWFRRLEKDTNSGLNTVFDLRSDDVFIANLYYQDFPVHGFTLQGTVVNDFDREGDRRPHYDENDFLQRPAPLGQERPRNYDITYLGLNGDGHFGRYNLTFSLYQALGSDSASPFTGKRATINAQFAAGEASYDVDWMRFKAFGLYASGDSDPFDDQERGFDAILENPNFAGADTSFWQRQAIPFIGGGGVILSGRNALLPSLRPSKDEGQSNFVNPGLVLAGIGADFDVLPQLRVVANASWLGFANTATLSVLRNQGPVHYPIGEDVSMGIIYRPLFTNNIIFRLSGAVLFPNSGFRDLFDTSSQSSPYYSVLANLTLTY
jgi:hypothetical protein